MVTFVKTSILQTNRISDGKKTKYNITSYLINGTLTIYLITLKSTTDKTALLENKRKQKKVIFNNC